MDYLEKWLIFYNEAKNLALLTIAKNCSESIKQGATKDFVYYDTIDLPKDTTAIVIFRDPYEVILSTYLKNDRRNEIEKKNVNSDILIKRIKEQKKYIFFWKSYFKEKKSNSDFLILDYSRLLSDTPNQLKRILNFYEYEINDDYIVKCAITHSKENTQNLFKEFKIYNRQRFSNVELKNNQKKLIYPVLEKNSEFSEIMKAYQEIIKKNNAL